MALANKTHTLAFYPKTEVPNAVTKVAPIPSEGASFQVQGQLTPVSSEVVFAATGLELTNAHLFLCDVEDVEDITANIRAEDESGISYAVRGKPKRWTVIAANSFGEVYLEQLEVSS